MFENYGDANFFEYGRLVEKTEDAVCFNVLVCDYVYDCADPADPERCFKFDHCYVDISDSWIDAKEVESYADCSKENEPELFALACIEYYGAENFDGIMYYDESQFCTENEIREKLKNYELDENIEL